MERGKQSGKAGRTRHDSFFENYRRQHQFPYHPASPIHSYIRLLSSCCPTLSSSSTPTHLIWDLSKEAEYKKAFAGELVPEQVPTSSKEVVSIHLQAVGKNDDSYIGHLVDFNGSWWMGLALGVQI